MPARNELSRRQKSLRLSLASCLMTALVVSQVLLGDHGIGGWLSTEVTIGLLTALQMAALASGIYSIVALGKPVGSSKHFALAVFAVIASVAALLAGAALLVAGWLFFGFLDLLLES